MVTVAGVFFATLADHTRKTFRDIFWNIEGFVCLLKGDLNETRTRHGNHAGDNFAQDEADSVNVAFGGCRCRAGKQFGCHIGWGTADDAKLCFHEFA